MATVQCPTLPPELWIRILRNLKMEEDLPDLWMSFRHVCTAFKDAVESIFCNEHLPKTWIQFNLGTHYTDDDDRIVLDSEFDFSHLSEDKVTAIFRIEEFSGECKSVIRGYLRNYVEDMDVEAPRHTVQIRRDVNDTPIPRLSIDYDKLELSCNWRELYTRFYGEEQLYHKLTGAWVKSKEEWAEDLKVKTDRGEVDMMVAMEEAIYAFTDGPQDSRKIARRARIRRQFRELDGREWDVKRDGDLVEETWILSTLAQTQQLASMEEYSDDEGEWKEEEAALDEDEWGDEDEDEQGEDMDEEDLNEE
jgi:hypothetical protein